MLTAKPLPKNFKAAYSKLTTNQLKKLLEINGIPFNNNDLKAVLVKTCQANDANLKIKEW